MRFLGLITSVNTKELEASHPRLLELNRVYRSNEKLEQIAIRVFGESRKTNGFMVVDGATLDPGRKEVTPTILPNEDHISICKPQSKNATLYKAVRTFIKRCLQNCQSLADLKTRDKRFLPQSIEANTYIEQGNYIQQFQDDAEINSKKKS